MDIRHPLYQAIASVLAGILILTLALGARAPWETDDA